MKTVKKAVTLALAFATVLAFTQQANAQASTAKPAANAAPVYKAKSPKLTRAQIDEWLAKPDQVVFIDVRRPDEIISNGGFPVYLSIQSKELEKNLASIPKDRSVVTVSNHAARGGAAADLLVAKGFNVVGAVGVEDYEAEGGKLTRITPPPPRPVASVTPDKK